MSLISPPFLASLRATPCLPRHTWYFVATVTLCVINRPDEIGNVLGPAWRSARSGSLDGGPQVRREKDGSLGGGIPERGRGRREEVVHGMPKHGEVVRDDDRREVSEGGKEGIKREGESSEDEDGEGEREDGLMIARKTRDALIKSIPVGGLPKAINALYALKKITPPSLLDEPLPLATQYPNAKAPDPYTASAVVTVKKHGTTEDILARGQALFDRVYGKVSNRVMGQMDRCGTPDLGLAARWMYGGILSGGHTLHDVLSPVETSFVLIAGLIPQDVNPQLKGHLKGALNNGATRDEVRAVRQVVMRICQEAGMQRLNDGRQSNGSFPPASVSSSSQRNDHSRRQGWGWKDDVADL